MKKIVSLGIISLMLSTTLAMAEEFSFEPVEIGTPPTSAANIVTTQEQDAQAVKSAGFTLDSAQNERFQNALLELDSIQVDIRDRLLEYKSQYAEVDAQYKKYKAERANLKKIIKQAEKKVKNIDKYKKNIRKDML